MELEIHNTGFINSPTTHLFPLAGQLGSRGVSSMINFEKNGIMQNIIKVYNPACQYYTRTKKREKCKKMKRTRIPPWGMVNRLERAYSKRFFFLLAAITISAN